MKKGLWYLLMVFGVFVGCSEDNPEEEVIIDPVVTIDKALLVDSVQVFNEIPSGNAEASRLGLRFFFSDFEPTGVYVKPNTTLKLEVEKLAGNSYPQLLVGSYSRGSEWNRQPISYDLHQGSNAVSVGSEGGMVYVRYINDGEPSGKVRIKFVDGWLHSPLYKLNDTSNANWKKMLATFDLTPTATLVGDKSFVVVSRDKAIDYQDKDQNSLLEAIDQIIQVENDLSGMDGSKDIHKPMSHKLMLVEYLGNDYYMFAYWYRTAYRKKDAVQFILDPAKLRQDGWGPWHEVGHMHQMNSWTWSGVVESTVNLYSLAVEKSFGISPSRYKRDNRWAHVATYLAQSDDVRDFNASETDIWVRLGMFYQLQLGFGDTFYPELHKYLREQNPTINGDEDRMAAFMLAACEVSKKDLTSFFQKWGMKFDSSEQVYWQIAELGYDAPESDLTLLTD
ncbi:hypothetical protein EYV94_01940 [Puteibacter caeruleilacunae]|nr:hypothetical protein EYV94_01940 [Puteibacter caeruleilacunae]